HGYWLVARDGGVFCFGDARFHGSTGAMHLNSPVLGLTPTASGKGDWLYARDGGIFAFGDAKFFGSTGGMRLNRAIVGMAAWPRGRRATATGWWRPTAASSRSGARRSGVRRGARSTRRVSQ